MTHIFLLGCLFVGFVVFFLMACRKKKRKSNADTLKWSFSQLHRDPIEDHDNFETFFEDTLFENENGSKPVIVDDLFYQTETTPSTAPVYSETVSEKTNRTEQSCQKEGADAALQNELIVLYLIAEPSHPYIGYELLQTLLSFGFRFGEMNIFHRHTQPNGTGPILFSLASLKEPGIFDIQNMGGVSCAGLTIFMRFSPHINVMSTFEMMIETARAFVEDLGGEILTHNKTPFTLDILEQYKTRISRYERFHNTVQEQTIP